LRFRAHLQKSRLRFAVMLTLRGIATYRDRDAGETQEPLK